MASSDYTRVANFLLSYGDQVSIPAIMDQIGVSEKRIRHIIEVFKENGLVVVDEKADTATVIRKEPFEQL